MQMWPPMLPLMLPQVRTPRGAAAMAGKVPTVSSIHSSTPMLAPLMFLPPAAWRRDPQAGPPR